MGKTTQILRHKEYKLSRVQKSIKNFGENYKWFSVKDRDFFSREERKQINHINGQNLSKYPYLRVFSERCCHNLGQLGQLV